MALGWKLAPVALLAPRANHGIVAFNKRLVVIGGQSSASVASLLIETAVVDEGGNLNPFKATAALPPAMNAGRCNFGLAQNAQHGKDLLYVVGGANPANTTAYVDVAIGQVNTDGSILWRVGPSLPVALSSVRAAIVGGWLYAIGGDTLTSTVIATNAWASQIQSDGTLGPWIAAAPFPGGGSQGGKISGHLAMGSKTWLYVGGGIPKGGAGSQFVWRAKADAGAGQNLYWDKEQLGMSAVRVNAAAPTLLLGPLAIVGGSTAGSAATALLTADELRLSGDGSINQLLKEDALPIAVTEAATAALNRWVFVAGGVNISGTYLSSVYIANLQADVQF